MVNLRPEPGLLIPPKWNEWWRRPGADGHMVVSANTNLTSTEDGDIVYKDYSSLVIDAGYALTVENRCKGLVICVRGDCTINGALTMTGKGARASAALVCDVAVAALGTVPYSILSDESLHSVLVGALYGISSREAGNNGTAATEGQTGGGASGAGSGSRSGGTGARGYPHGGGPGGGGASSTADGANAGQTYGGMNGGDGGAGTYPGGGGAGNPGGTGNESGGAGIGGFLVLIVGGTLTVGATGVISANGKNGGNGVAGLSGGGGGSGGGRIILIYRVAYNNSGSVVANGGTGGTGKYAGGAGGAGSISAVQLT